MKKTSFGSRALRTVVGIFLTVICASSMRFGYALAASFANPIVEASPRTGSADPSVVFYRDYYYYCRSISSS